MVDFSKLRPPLSAAEELEADDERRLARAIAGDTARRRKWSRKRRLIPLSQVRPYLGA